MTAQIIKGWVVAFTLAAATAALNAQLPKGKEAPGPSEPTLAEVKSATERFTDVNVALKEGYIRDPFSTCARPPT